MSYFTGSRSVPISLIDSIQNEPLYKNHLKKDIYDGDVYPAFRKSRIDFYHNGGKLFQYDGNFSTHIKFASVAKSSKQKLYVTESDLSSSIVLISNFSEGYERIKEICSKYSGPEDKGISSIYKRFSPISKSKVIVLDIEIAFTNRGENEEEDSNRIDMLLYNTESRELRFYEAKDFYNKEIWSLKGKKPQVVEQIRRYEEQIQKDKEEIVAEYSEYIEKTNLLFATNMPKPKSLDDQACLFIFGFDNSQKSGKLKELLLSDNSLEGILHYEVGDTKQAKITSIWDVAKCD